MNETIPEHAIRDHATLGGSSAERWTNCPGSVFHLKSMPPEITSDAALEGTEAHELAEKMLSVFLQHKVTGEHGTIPLHENADMYDAAAQYVKLIWEQVLDSSITDKAYGLEERFIIDEKHEMYGYVDFWAIYIDSRGKRAGCIVDFKYGYHYVQAEKNAQLAYYAVALREEIKRGGKNLDYVRAVIIQPRAGGDIYREVKFSSKQLDAWKKKFIKAAVTIFVDKKAKFKAGHWCKWCRAQAICTQFQKELQTKAALSLAEPDITLLPEPSQVDDNTVVRLVLHAAKVEDFLKRVKDYAKARQLSDNPLPGLKCVAGPTRRTWIKDEGSVAEALKGMGVAETHNLKLKGITEVEKELTKLYSKKEAKELTERFVMQTVPAVILVSDSDERPAIGSDVLLLSEKQKEE